jgi:hypothetical protein
LKSDASKTIHAGMWFFSFLNCINYLLFNPISLFFKLWFAHNNFFSSCFSCYT